MTQHSKILCQILDKIRHAKDQKSQTLAVFDLDSTLFDVSPRLQRIMIDFAELPENKRKYPDSCKILQTVQTEKTDWGIKNALTRAGLDGHHPSFHHDLKEYWMHHFFSNHYLQYDLPYEGAQEYVNLVHQAGAHIAYLTGRDIARMGTGTLETLKKWDFPVEKNRTELILKPEKGIDDAQFKSQYFADIPSGQFSNIWFFENEPVNTNLVQNDHQHVEIIFFESTHSGKANPHPDLPRIFHYLLDQEEIG